VSVLNSLPEGSRRVGRPLSRAVGQAIVDATAAILGEVGYSGLTIERVAQRAGVARQTIYRRWPSKVDVVGAVLAARQNIDVPLPDTGGLRGDLTMLARRFNVRQRSGPEFLHELVFEARYDPALAAIVDAYIGSRRDQVLAVISRAFGRGELRSETDPQTLADLFYGFAWYRRLISRATITAEDDERVIDTLLRGALKEGRPEC